MARRWFVLLGIVVGTGMVIGLLLNRLLAAST